MALKVRRLYVHPHFYGVGYCQQVYLLGKGKIRFLQLSVIEYINYTPGQAPWPKQLANTNQTLWVLFWLSIFCLTGGLLFVLIFICVCVYLRRG